MKLIIKRLEVHNFKVFEKLELTLDSNHLIVLDGPNGFGKSSFFDALELLLTGKIRRYIELEELTVDRRSLRTGCPWLFKQARDDDWLSIRAEIIVDGQSRFLERAASKAVLDEHRGVTDLRLPLYELADFKAERGEAISQEEAYFSTLLGEQYQRDFELFHYIEQEENTRLLKQKEKDRQGQIAHLFDIGDIQDKINNITQASNKIGKLCNPQKSVDLKALKDKWDAAKLQILPIGSSVAYERIIMVTEQPWDREVVDFDTSQFEQLLSANGELFRIQRFIENFSHYENKLYNDDLEIKLLPRIELQQRFLMLYRNVEHRHKWEKEIACYDSAVTITNAFKNIMKSISENRLMITPPLLTLLPDTFSPENFQTQVSELKQLLSTTDKVQECHTSLMQTREQMVSTFNELQSNGDATNICPTCGYLWPTAVALLEGIENQRIILENVAMQQNNQLSQALTRFRLNWQEPIELALQPCLQQNKDNIALKRQLVKLSEEQLLWLENYYKQLMTADINFNDLLSDDFEPITQQKIDELKRRVHEKFKSLDDSCIYDDFERVYREIFNNDHLAVKSIKSQQLDLKKSYLVQLHSIASSKYISECEREYKNAELLIKKSRELKGYLLKLKKIYEDEKRTYLESIVKEIEILFHIYSGRLMQNYQQGLGIFIENDGNSIAFNETPGHEHDVVFSMSSGQLSALVLSFTLALNQRYAKHTLLLVDDPVQTLDEINVAGFIDLLRTEFKDRQIIMSTHEDRISAYFRYKYKKFGMSSGRINFMEHARSSIDNQ
ncbi:MULTISPECIES: AAA family ATPase [unclassified Aeromonas]|uniref:AAA family ATPase n=1 Tax=unclassified Aeromonas TaxID=257493 RepID=UPI00084B725C|nr:MULTISPECIES: AAA family ATPase [unclassified Aeromonas]OEC54245.1 purine NTPase [Aeromonas sp. ANNP30]OEC66761.1 purine NTPase [Aeromonas sp. ANP5]